MLLFDYLIKQHSLNSYMPLVIILIFRVFSWGWGVHGQLGLKLIENAHSPEPMKLLSHKVPSLYNGCNISNNPLLITFILKLSFNVFSCMIFSLHPPHVLWSIILERRNVRFTKLLINLTKSNKKNFEFIFNRL